MLMSKREDAPSNEDRSYESLSPLGGLVRLNLGMDNK